MKTLSIQSAVFKAKCLQLMDDVNEHGVEFIITKHGKPVAKLVSIKPEIKKDFFGCLKGTVTIQQDIVEPLNEQWESNE